VTAYGWFRMTNQRALLLWALLAIRLMYAAVSSDSCHEAEV
jgi:hypothetical protein